MPDGSETRERPAGLRLIIAYKLAKGPLMLLAGLFLVFRANVAFHRLDLIATHGALLGQIARWMSEHLRDGALAKVRLIAIGDGILTTFEGVLLAMAHPWAEWIVVASVGSLLPFELYAIAREPHPLRIAVFLANALVVGYLVRRRLSNAPSIRPARR